MRRRLVLAIAGVAAFAVILFALPLALLLQRTYSDEELLRIQRDTIATTRAVDLSRDPGDPIELPPSRDVLTVYDRSGRRIAGNGSAAADSVVRAALRTGAPADHAGAGRLVVAVPLLVAERVAGAVRAERSDAAARRDARHAWLALGGAAAVIVVLAALAALALGRRLVAPLDRLAAAARRLGDGDFAARAPRAGMGELDSVAEALDATAARLDELLTRERSFSADASHQLRTPIAALRLELEAIELRGDGPPELPTALAQVERLQETVETLLAVARDAPDPDRAADLAVLADRLQERWTEPLAAAGRPLRIAVRTPDAVARATPGVIEQILDVLVANALHHGRGTVTVTVRGADRSLALDVADEGPGFSGDPEGAFARRASAGNGHGIGLALARSLADAEGGRLLVARAGPGPVLTLLLRRQV
jgi:signal transduction histidine kinase